MVAHRRLAVFQGTFRDSWAAAKMAEFMAVQQRPRYRVLRVVKDWETGTAYHGGGVIALNGAETQAFLRLLRWAGAKGPVGRVGGEMSRRNPPSARPIPPHFGPG